MAGPAMEWVVPGLTEQAVIATPARDAVASRAPYSRPEARQLGVLPERGSAADCPMAGMQKLRAPLERSYLEALMRAKRHMV